MTVVTTTETAVMTGTETDENHDTMTLETHVMIAVLTHMIDARVPVMPETKSKTVTDQIGVTTVETVIVIAREIDRVMHDQTIVRETDPEIFDQTSENATVMLDVVQMIASCSQPPMLLPAGLGISHLGMARDLRSRPQTRTPRPPIGLLVRPSRRLLRIRCLNHQLVQPHPPTQDRTRYVI